MVALALIISGVGLLLTWHVDEVHGVVTADGRPVAGAVVRIKTTDFQAITDRYGRFSLDGFPDATTAHVTAWLDGYYIGGAVAWPWTGGLAISLQHYASDDNPDYAWILPLIEERGALMNFMTSGGLSIAAWLSLNRAFLPLASRLDLGCANCHGGIIVEQWVGSAHARGTSNSRFMTMYNGTDVDGNESPLTRYSSHRDYGRFPLRPDPDVPYFGPGFKLDFPDQAGTCAVCHAPTAALASTNGRVDVNGVTGVDALGVHCDFCHKVVDVRLNPLTGLPYENMPGVTSMELHRPSGDTQLFFGPYDDVDVGPDTYSALQNQSRFCAACHNASFWGTPIYESFAEWRDSPYPAEGKSCQGCHMKPDGSTTNFAPGRGGVERDPESIFTHSYPGASDVDLLRDTAVLELNAWVEGGMVVVEVSVTNENGGHHIPTDQPMRNIFLVVSASDRFGRALTLATGPTIPDWGGLGDEPDDFGGRPGRGYAKVLEELWTEVSPTAAYWNPTDIASDTRIAARETDRSRYEFAANGGPVTIEATLIFRRAFKELAEHKGWDDPDIVMEAETVTVE